MMGFNIKFVVGPVARDLVCPLCRGVLVDPLVMHPCQHTVCSSCLKAFRPVPQLLKTCPLCRNPLFEEPSLAAGNIINRLLKLTVKCHRECGHQCELSALPAHVLGECKFGTIECPNKSRGCRKEMTRKKMDAHVEECDYRMVTCEGCNAQMVYSRLSLHQKRRRCVEGKLMTQRARSAAIAMRQVREHQEHLRKEAITFEGQLTRLRSSKLEARVRQKSAPPRIAIYSEGSSSNLRPKSSRSSISVTSRPKSSRSLVSTTSLSSSSSMSTQSIGPRRLKAFITDNADNISIDGIPLLNTTSSESSSISSTRVTSEHASEQETDTSEPMDVASENIGDQPESNSSITMARHHDNRTEMCKRCGKSFNPAKNNDRACRWHRGPIVNLFGGTCMICGQLNFKRGCVTGYHLTT